MTKKEREAFIPIYYSIGHEKKLDESWLRVVYTPVPEEPATRHTPGYRRFMDIHDVYIDDIDITMALSGEQLDIIHDYIEDMNDGHD